MNKLETIENFVVLEKLIRQKRTGTAKDLARRISVSRSTVFRMIDELNSRGAKIEFCPLCKSYVYGSNRVVNIKLSIYNLSEMTDEEMKEISGGTKILSCFLPQSQI